MELKQLKHLPRAWKRGTDFLGTRYAIMCGAMTWVSEANLVAAISNEGGFGVLAGGNMPPEILAKEIAKTREKTRNPFGVNLITVAPAFKAARGGGDPGEVPVRLLRGEHPVGAGHRGGEGRGAEAGLLRPGPCRWRSG